MSILMSLFSPYSRLQDSVLTPEIASYCSLYFLTLYHIYDEDFFFYFDVCFSGNISQSFELKC